METTAATAPLSLKKWILLNLAGWLLGVVLIVGLALLGETVLHLSDQSGSQAVVGIGMGAGVGWMQALALRHNLHSSRPWIWASLLGMSSSYVLFDIVGYLTNWEVAPEIGLLLATALGAIISSRLQANILQQNHIPKASHWMFYNTLGWVLAHGLTASMYVINLNQWLKLPSVVLIILAFAFLFIGGPVLGYLTGRYLIPALKANRTP